jgi:hypothetical protein
VRHCPAAEQLPTTNTHCCPEGHSELVTHPGPAPDDEPPDDEPLEVPDDEPPDDDTPEDEPPEEEALPEDDPPSGESLKVVVEPPHAAHATKAKVTSVTAVERSMAAGMSSGRANPEYSGKLRRRAARLRATFVARVPPGTTPDARSRTAQLYRSAFRGDALVPRQGGDRGPIFSPTATMTDGRRRP